MLKLVSRLGLCPELFALPSGRVLGCQRTPHERGIHVFDYQRAHHHEGAGSC